MDPDEFIRGLVSVALVVTMSLGANCQGAAGSVVSSEHSDIQLPYAGMQMLSISTDPETDSRAV